MNQKETERLKVDDLVVWKGGPHESKFYGEQGVVRDIQPDQHYIRIEWSSDGAISHLDTRDCANLSRGYENAAHAGRAPQTEER